MLNTHTSWLLLRSASMEQFLCSAGLHLLLPVKENGPKPEERQRTVPRTIRITKGLYCTRKVKEHGLFVRCCCIKQSKLAKDGSGHYFSVPLVSFLKETCLQLPETAGAGLNDLVGP